MHTYTYTCIIGSIHTYVYVYNLDLWAKMYAVNCLYFGNSIDLDLAWPAVLL